MTGDVTINPSASALVMTTEVRERSQNFVMLCLWAPTYRLNGLYVKHFIDFKKYAVSWF
jgi:hypothetical protein